MCTAGNSEAIIILSDDDDEDDKENDLCLIVDVNDHRKSPDLAPTSSVPDEDLVVTFSRRADVLPHARHDCPVHPFVATEHETGCPLANNELFCEQCFCFVCDKLASQCVVWCHSGVCHCNSHIRSNFWSQVRYVNLLGDLAGFNLALSEIDSHLRRAATMLQNFKEQLFKLFSSYSLTNNQKSDQSQLVQDYTSVFEFVSSFLNKADEQDCKAAAIMHLGAAKQFITHFQVSRPTESSPTSEVSAAKMMLLQRVIKTVQKLIVMADLQPDFIKKLQDFYQKQIFFPVELRRLRSSLQIRLWDDILLVSVLRGQNVTGDRRFRGRKDVLVEQISVVLLRTELLQRRRRYRELCRYLRAVQTDNFTLFQRVQDLIPYFMCLYGDFMSALINLFSSTVAPASRLTPQLFLFYLRVFKTATAPKMVVSEPEQLCCSDASWETIKDRVPLKCTELVKFALKAQRFSSSVYADSQCWSSLLEIVNSPRDSTVLLAPSPQFLQEARRHVNALLLVRQDSNLQIPRTFLEVYPDQALLLLVTGALGLRIIYASLRPALPVLNAFKENLWAFQWLCENLSSSEERFNSFIRDIAQEAKNTTGVQLDITLDPFRVKLPPQTEARLPAASSSPQTAHS